MFSSSALPTALFACPAYICTVCLSCLPAHPGYYWRLFFCHPQPNGHLSEATEQVISKVVASSSTDKTISAGIHFITTEPLVYGTGGPSCNISLYSSAQTRDRSMLVKYFKAGPPTHGRLPATRSQVRKRISLTLSILKTIILPRQARDKHREALKNNPAFSQSQSQQPVSAREQRIAKDRFARTALAHELVGDINTEKHDAARRAHVKNMHQQRLRMVRIDRKHPHTQIHARTQAAP